MQLNNRIVQLFFIEDMFDTLTKYKIQIERDQSLDWNFLSCISTTERVLNLFWNKLNKSHMVIFNKLSEPFIISHITEFQDVMKYISFYQKLSRGFIDTYKHLLSWTNLIQSQDLCDPADMSLVVSCDAYIDKNELIMYNKVSQTYLEDNFAILNKLIMSRKQILSESFIDAHIIDFTPACFKSMLLGGSINTETLVDKYISHLDVNDVVEHVQLSETFLNTHYADIDKNKLVIYQKNLPITFLRLHADDLDWYLISKHVQLSYDMFIEFDRRIDWDIASKYQQIPDAIIMNPDFFKKMNSKLLSKFNTLSNAAMLRYGGTLDPHYISIYQTIDNTILESQLNFRLSFTNLSVYSNITEPNLTKYTNKWNHNLLAKYQDLPIAYLTSNISKFDNKYTLTRYHGHKFDETFITNNEIYFDFNILSKVKVDLSEAFITAHRTKMNIDYIIKYNTSISNTYRTSLRDWYMSQP